LENGPGYTVTKWVSKVQSFTLQWTERDTFSTKREEWNTN